MRKKAQTLKHLGLTGGIGSGKSTVAAMFAELGATIIDADAISRQLMEPGESVLAQVVEQFGATLLDSSGRLDRPALAALVFADDEARQRLNSIVHPAVREESARQLSHAAQENPEGAIVIQDIPLLTETGQASEFPDGVIVVHTAEEIRLQRLTQDRGMDLEDAQSRIKAQASDEERAAIATWVIDNSATLEVTRAQVEALWSQLIA